MRLIDADKLEPTERYVGDEWTRIVYMDDIDEMPTIDAEPVKIDIERFKKEIADYTNESGYVDIPLSILIHILYEVTE